MAPMIGMQTNPIAQNPAKVKISIFFSLPHRGGCGRGETLPPPGCVPSIPLPPEPLGLRGEGSRAVTRTARYQ